MADDPTDAPAKDAEPKSDLGDAGKKALDAERKARREADAALATLKAELDDLKGKDKGEVQKLTEQNASLKSELDAANAKALRLEVAAEKGVKARWLSGNTREELEATADEYLTEHPPAQGGQPTPAKPTEDLKGGGDPTEEPTETDPQKLAATVPRL